ncbi:MAG: queuosine precursor transporter [Planctomycetota bacterium]
MSKTPARAYRYFDLIVGGFVAVLLCSNLIGPGKVALVGGIAFGVGNIFFPISYIFGDVLTEVYGYARARRAIWAGFAAMSFATLMSWSVRTLPADPSEPWNETLQPALDVVFGNTGRIVVASVVAFVVGDFVNSYVMARMKVLTQGRHLWTRTIGSTIVGQGCDSLLFYPIAFYGVWRNERLLTVLLTNWWLKVGVEVLMTPLTYWIVNVLKRAEHEDFMDVDTDFNPFRLDA